MSNHDCRLLQTKVPKPNGVGEFGHRPGNELSLGHAMPFYALSGFLGFTSKPEVGRARSYSELDLGICGALFVWVFSFLGLFINWPPLT